MTTKKKLTKKKPRSKSVAEIKKQAKDMIELFNKYYNISYESGKNECIKNNDKWINDKAYYKVFMYTKALIKKIIKIFKSKHVQ